mmetsp:Transcript_16995/g.27110  ORF Transcript_16995/g.27110 Transcript_16995/m.27110 type:complete len:95 (+) Transcript_16995:244-528(+)
MTAFFSNNGGLKPFVSGDKHFILAPTFNHIIYHTIFIVPCRLDRLNVAEDMRRIASLKTAHILESNSLGRLVVLLQSERTLLHVEYLNKATSCV